MLVMSSSGLQKVENLTLRSTSAEKDWFSREAQHCHKDKQWLCSGIP